MHTILVFPHQTSWDGNPANGGVECRWGRQKSRFSMAGGMRPRIVTVDPCMQFTAQTATHQRILFITTSMDDHDK